jgi:ABC-type glycerol-3-phosphate transport system permease component
VSARWATAGLVAGSALLVALLALGPFLYVLSSAFKPTASLFQYPPEWIPSEPYTGNFTRLLGGDFPQWTLNTLIVAGTITLFKLWFDSMAAYAFAKLRFPGQRPLFGLMLLTIMVPPVALIIPLFFIVRDLGGLNTYWALIIPPMANPIGIFMLRGFIQALPDELEAAARVDGASPLRTYFNVILPVIKPGLVVVGLYTFLLQYTNFVWPLVIAPEKPLLTTGLASLKGLFSPDWGLISAGSLLAMVPITVVFLVFQRAFVGASMAAAIKG